jgi:hypothetical protein
MKCVSGRLRFWNFVNQRPQPTVVALYSQWLWCQPLEIHLNHLSQFRYISTYWDQKVLQCKPIPLAIMALIKVKTLIEGNWGNGCQGTKRRPKASMNPYKHVCADKGACTKKYDSYRGHSVEFGQITRMWLSDLWAMSLPHHSVFCNSNRHTMNRRVYQWSIVSKGYMVHVL